MWSLGGRIFCFVFFCWHCFFALLFLPSFELYFKSILEVRALLSYLDTTCLLPESLRSSLEVGASRVVQDQEVALRHIGFTGTEPNFLEQPSVHQLSDPY